MRQTRVSVKSFEGPCQRIVWPEAREGAPDSFLLIQRGADWFAFQNFCPHWRIPLAERGPDAFDGQSGYLICTSHAAIFRLRDGLCVSGPCEDESLDTLEVQRDGEDLVVREPRRGLQMDFSGLALPKEE